MALAGRQGHSAEHGLEERRLARSVGADDCQPILPAHLQIQRTQPERAALDDGMVEADDDVAAARRGRESEVEVPSLPRLLGDLQTLDGALGRLGLARQLLRRLHSAMADELVRVRWAFGGPGRSLAGPPSL